MNVGDLVVQPRGESRDRRFFGYGIASDGWWHARFSVNYLYRRGGGHVVIQSGTGNRSLPVIIESPVT